MRKWWVALLVALAMVGAACSSGDDDDASEDETSEETAGGDGEGWTILHYSMADTNLEGDMMTDLDEMGNVGSSDGFNLVGLVDRSVEYTDQDALGLGDWTGARYVHIGQGSGEVLEEWDALDLGDPQTLADFIEQGVADFPAEHYALLISDHGGGWTGMGPDDGSGNVLGLTGLQDSISAGLEAAGVDKLDLLGFDACLMATYEVASALAPLADRLIASSELEPGHGWDYNVLDVVGSDPTVDVDTLGTALVDGFLGQAQAEGQDANVTLSLVDLTQMAALDEAMAAFTTALVERADVVSPTVGRSLAGNLSYGKNPDPTMDPFMTDLGDLVAQIGIEALDVSSEADAVLRAINDAVLHKVSGPSAADFTGMSIYFPPVEDFYSADYATIPENPSGWGTFLSTYYAAGAAIPEDQQPTFTSEDATVTFDEDGLYIEGTFDVAAQDNLASAYIQYGLIGEDGSVTFIGDEQAEVSDDGSGLATGFYDLQVLNLTDGVDEALAYLTLTYADDQDGFNIDIPMAYYAPGAPLDGESYQDVLLEVVVDGEQNVVQETYYTYDETAGTFGEGELDPEGLLVPEVLTIDADGNATWQPTSDVGLYADLPNILYNFEKLTSGMQLFVELIVTDFGGNQDSVSAIVTIP